MFFQPKRCFKNISEEISPVFSNIFTNYLEEIYKNMQKMTMKRVKIALKNKITI